MIVLKFGGTSVQDAAALGRLTEIVASRKGKRLIVVSALSGVTDALVDVTERVEKGDLSGALAAIDSLRDRHLKLASEISASEPIAPIVSRMFEELGTFLTAVDAVGEFTARSRDRIFATGELASSRLVADLLERKLGRCAWIDPREALKTDSRHGKAAVDFQATERAIRQKTGEGELFLTGGYVGSDAFGVTTTLGRGGSDYSASVLGTVAGASVIEIWTDVDGILTTDPRIVPKARRIERLHFDEAAELAFFGAKVLHPDTIAPAILKGIPVKVLNSRNASSPGTEISGTGEAAASVVKAIACKKRVTLVNLHSLRMLGAAGFLEKVFKTFASQGIPVDLISTSEVNVSVTVDPDVENRRLERAVEELSQIARVSVSKDKASVSAVGYGLRSAAGVAMRAFRALEGLHVSMVSMGASEVNLSLVVEAADVEKAVGRLHAEFCEN
jgi:aspartate kinase